MAQTYLEAKLAQLEKGCAPLTDVLTVSEVTAISTAISLRRIADSLGRLTSAPFLVEVTNPAPES